MGNNFCTKLVQFYRILIFSHQSILSKPLLVHTLTSKLLYSDGKIK